MLETIKALRFIKKFAQESLLNFLNSLMVRKRNTSCHESQ